MRIAHLAKYTFHRMGGIERHVGILTRALVARGHDVTVFCYDPSRLSTPRLIDGVHVEPIPTLASISSQSIAPRLISRCRALARERPFDIVHQHWPDPFAHLAATLIPGQPAHVVSWHCDIVRQRLLRPIYRAIAPKLLAKPDALIGATLAHLRSDQIPCFAPPERRHVIPYSIDITPFTTSTAQLQATAELRKQYGGGPLIFSLGRHVYYKGFEVLIRAMAHVPATLLLGGEGPLTSQLRQLSNAANARVHFLGMIPESELPLYYHAADVYCLPSIAQTEAFGLVQAEAMACQKPLVNTDLHNGVNELAPNNLCAITVPPNDELALADALNRLIQNPTLAARLGAAGYERISTQYTVTAMVDAVTILYNELLRSRRSGRERGGNSKMA